MKASDLPSKIVLPFADGAGSTYRRDVPVPSQIGVTNGAASFTDGFPPDTFQALTAGGVPADGKDVNGLLHQMSAWDRWLAAGGPARFDAGFANSIGGYPLGATVQSNASPQVSFVSLVDNNTTDPNSGVAGVWAVSSAALYTVGTFACTPNTLNPVNIFWNGPVYRNINIQFSDVLTAGIPDSSSPTGLSHFGVSIGIRASDGSISTTSMPIFALKYSQKSLNYGSIVAQGTDFDTSQMRVLSNIYGAAYGSLPNALADTQSTTEVSDSRNTTYGELNMRHQGGLTGLVLTPASTWLSGTFTLHAS